MVMRDDAKKALLKLFHCFHWTADEIERKEKFAAYWEILETPDPRFVCEACEYAAKGKVGDGRFLPTAAELFQAAEGFSARDAQRKRVPQLEFIQQNDAATRQRIRDGFAKLLADLSHNNPIDPDKATKDVFYPATNVCDSVDRHGRQRVERAAPMSYSIHD